MLNLEEFFQVLLIFIRILTEQFQISPLELGGLVISLFNAFWISSVTFNGATVATVLVYSSAAFLCLTRDVPLFLILR